MKLIKNKILKRLKIEKIIILRNTDKEYESLFDEFGVIEIRIQLCDDNKIRVDGKTEEFEDGYECCCGDDKEFGYTCTCYAEYIEPIEMVMNKLGFQCHTDIFGDEIFV